MSARRATRLRGWYAASVVLLGAVLVGVTALALRSEAQGARATADARVQEDLRAALWRMESRVGSMLALTSMGVDAQRAASVSNRIEAASNTVIAADPLPDDVRAEAEREADVLYLSACASPALDTAPEASTADAESGSWVANDYSQRAARSNPSQQLYTGPADENWTIGPAAALFCELPSSGDTELLLARRIEGPRGVSHRVDVLAWEDLRSLLRDEIVDLFPGAELVALGGSEATGAPLPDGLRLAALPIGLAVDLDAEREKRTDGTGRRPLLAALGIAWAAFLAALGFGFVAQRASVRYGDRHRRFTHAVTHELRTPLTTFRMYSEMLSRGMVPPDAAPEYLATLERESARLSGLVENVLRYARLEEGAGAGDTESIELTALVERLRGDLERLAGAHGARLEVEVSPGTARTDVDAAGQILANLVENAGKYGCEEQGCTIRLEAAQAGRAVHIDVIDDGPGLDGAAAKRAFEPFERAGRSASDPQPGVGLGLALARDLAEALGGTLELCPRRDGEGARFRLGLPAA